MGIVTKYNTIQELQEALAKKMEEKRRADAVDDVFSEEDDNILDENVMAGKDEIVENEFDDEDSVDADIDDYDEDDEEIELAEETDLLESEYQEITEDEIFEIIEEMEEKESDEEVEAEMIAELELENEIEDQTKSKTTKLTINIDDDIVKKIKVLAILRETSIKDLTEECLKELVIDSYDEFIALFEKP